MTKTDALATKQDTALAVPTGMEDMITAVRPEGKDEGTLGNEGITRSDLLMPRIGIAQKMSPEIDPTNAARYIEGLTFTDFYHSTKKVSLGKGPLHFVILRRDNPRWVEFNPLETGGGIKDLNVHAGERHVMPDGSVVDRTKFGPAGEKPIATEFHDFIVLLLTGFDPQAPMDSIVALSLKSSGIQAAKHLNLLIQLRGPKLICKGVYTVTAGHKTDKKTQGVYATYNFANAGWLKEGSPIETLAIEMFDAWKSRAVEFEREPGDEDFDGAAMDAAAPAPTEM